MAIRIVVLGSGTIIPRVGTRATALLVEAGGDRVLFDCGPGALDALEENGISFRSLRTIALTHYHPDHSLGLAHLLAALNADPIAPVACVLTVYGPAGLKEHVAGMEACYPSIAPKRYTLDLIEIGEGSVARDCAASLSAAAAIHGNMKALSYRLDFGGSSVVFTGDTAESETLARFSKEASCLIAECSFPDARSVEGHLTPAGVGRLAAAAGVGCVVLVHMYPLFAAEDPVAGVRRHYAGPVEVGYDSMEFDIGSGMP
jgi:ribonuclease BN (tRNA processing enzyme)